MPQQEEIYDVLNIHRLGSPTVALAIQATSTGAKIGTSTAQCLSFWNATPAAKPSAITQTYSTASSTSAALPTTTLVNSGGGTASFTIASLGSAGTAAVPQAYIDAITNLATVYNALRVDVVNAKSVQTQIIDQLQTIGLFA